MADHLIGGELVEVLSRQRTGPGDLTAVEQIDDLGVLAVASCLRHRKKDAHRR